MTPSASYRFLLKSVEHGVRFYYRVDGAGWFYGGHGFGAGAGPDGGNLPGADLGYGLAGAVGGNSARTDVAQGSPEHSCEALL
jgi:hypothetical protein